MKRHGTRVRWSCETCKAWGEVELEPLIETLGPDGSLWDRHPPCKIKGCDGKVLFLASAGSGTPFRPLISTGRRVVGLPE